MVDMPGRLGAIGRHALRTGPWFDARFWLALAATCSWLVVMARQLPCAPNDESTFPNPYLRLCYTDISTLYLVRGIDTGEPLYSQVPLEYPVLTGFLIAAVRLVVALLGYRVSPDASYTERIEAAQVFFHLTAIGLFGCFLVLVLVHLKLSKNPRHTLIIAASPLVMLSGLINWDLFVVMLTSVAIYLWMKKYPLWAGIVIGLAFAAKFYPVILLIAITLVCLRAGKYRELLFTWGGAVLAWAAVNLPVMIVAFDGWSYFWTMNANRGADLGSIWYVLSLLGLPMGQAALYARLCTLIGGVAVVFLVATAPLRPRLAQVTFLLLFVFLAFNTVYSPQYCLWLLPILALARPDRYTVGVWTLAEAVYYVAVWGFLEGIIGPGSGSDLLYWLAVIIRIFVQLWVALIIIDDIRRPWEDPIRLPYVDDPIGGVVDHSADLGLLKIGNR